MSLMPLIVGFILGFAACAASFAFAFRAKPYVTGEKRIASVIPAGRGEIIEHKEDPASKFFGL